MIKWYYMIYCNCRMDMHEVCKQLMPQEHLWIASNRRLHCEAARVDAFCSGCKKVGAVACEAPTQWICWAMDIPKSSSYAATAAIGGSCSLKLKLSWYMPWLLRRPLSSQKWDASSFTSCCQACREPRLFLTCMNYVGNLCRKNICR